MKQQTRHKCHLMSADSSKQKVTLTSPTSVAQRSTVSKRLFEKARPQRGLDGPDNEVLLMMENKSRVLLSLLAYHVSENESQA